MTPQAFLRIPSQCCARYSPKRSPAAIVQLAGRHRVLGTPSRMREYRRPDDY